MGAATRLLLTAVLLLGTATGVLAQRQVPRTNKKGDLILRDPLPHRLKSWFLAEFTADQWLDAPEFYEPNYIPRGFNVYLLKDFLIGESPLSLATGAGISATNVHTNTVFELDEFGLAWEMQPASDETDLRVNKFSTTYLEVPIELRLITKWKTPFHIAAGFRVGYLLQSKQVFRTEEETIKIIGYDGVNMWRYGVNARIGFGAFALTGYYSLVPLFEAKKGPQIIPISMGIAFVPR